MQPQPLLRRPEFTWPATSLALLFLAIFLGSRGFRELDRSLLGYVVGTAFFIGGSAYRLSFFLGRPQARMYVRGAWAYLADKSVRRAVKRRHSAITAAKGVATNLAAQDFIWRRGWFRWLLHLNIAWGCLLSFAITFPLVFGWVRFNLTGPHLDQYDVMVMGFRLATFPIRSWMGFMTYHALDFTAAMVVLGVGLAYFKRYRKERDFPEARSEWDLLPLHLLLAVAATGLLLTVSSAVLNGAGYTTITLTHQVLVIVTLAYIPFSKLFHFLFRPLAVAVMIYHEAAAAPQTCRSCGAAYAPAKQIADLKDVLGAKGYSQPLMDAHLTPVSDAAMLDLCPACKREYRVRRYLTDHAAYEGRLLH
jgi:hypothetical protein